MHEVAQKLMNTLLFSFQDLKLSTKDIIAVLKDTLNTTSSPLPIPDPHATGVPSNSLERHSIGSRVVDGVHNLLTSFSMAKLMGFPDAPPSSLCDPKGSKELDLRKWSETWCRSQLPALRGVEGSCWKLRD
jgi:hypothetical protein